MQESQQAGAAGASTGSLFSDDDAAVASGLHRRGVLAGVARAFTARWPQFLALALLPPLLRWTSFEAARESAASGIALGTPEATLLGGMLWWLVYVALEVVVFGAIT